MFYSLPKRRSKKIAFITTHSASKALPTVKFFKYLSKISAFVVFLSLLSTQAQEKTTTHKDTQNITILKQKGMFLGFGGVYQSFQDSRYTNLIYRGMGYGLHFGYNNQNEKRIWKTGLRGFYGTKTTTVGRPYHSIVARIYVDYLQNIFHIGKKHFYLGGSLDIVGVHLRFLKQKEGGSTHLANNPGGGIFDFAQLSVKGLFMYDLNTKWQWQSGFAARLFGWAQQTPSFATGTSQHLLTKQTFEGSEMLPFRLHDFQPFYKYVNVSINNGFVYKNRWMLNYRWIFKRSREVVDYPVTMGLHFIELSYQF